MSHRPRPRLLLVDDHHLMLEGLRLALQDEYEIVGMVTTGEAVLEECRRVHPQCVLLDLGLPGRSGLEVITDLHAAIPGIKIIIVTMYADRVLAEAGLQSGAQGFVPKDAGPAELKVALSEVLEGRRYLSPLIPKHGPGHAPGEMALGMARLTPRQREIVELIGDGKSTARIAKELHLSHWTVTFHRTRIRKALGLDTEWSLVRYALLVRMSEAEKV
jgi:DNA-binding NarL/FixJ family response regulator